MEETRRINPTSATLRELYILSGNKCAYPQCTHEIIDETGKLVAELCHIEAAMPGGERFNPEMTNKERAQSSNLLFLCHKHHKVTDDVDEFSVAKMKDIKHQHENLFRNIMDDMLRTVEDITQKQVLIKSKSFKRMNKVLNWNLDNSDLKGTVTACNNNFEILKQLNKNTRLVFSVFIERSEFGHQRSVLLSLVQQSLNLSDYKMHDYIDILIQYDLISDPYIYENYRGYVSDIKDPDGWDMWGEIKKYCESIGVSLQEIIVDLDFEKLD
ncbi:hypothetical protein [Exiguobacterium sp. ERU656]|uniref:hypothetical protein n=1 Tax=Exiguobacterium sp. ERU656 TaxID=2751217 RepID=UPI001BECA3B6|nr:hypothetical protein [Exiguobacterium sp. ERU656]